jgi:hypothetical protein
MPESERQFWSGIAVLVLAGLLLVGPNVASLPHSGTMSAVAVLELAAGAALVGTAEEGQPV